MARCDRCAYVLGGRSVGISWLSGGYLRSGSVILSHGGTPAFFSCPRGWPHSATRRDIFGVNYLHWSTSVISSHEDTFHDFFVLHCTSGCDRLRDYEVLET